MKALKFFFFAALAAIAASMSTSCTDYQDEIDALDRRVYRLENLVDSLNKNMAGLKMLIDAQADKGWLIIGMAELPGGNGYLINFGKLDKDTGELSTKPDDRKTITIYNGLDAAAPQMSLQQDPTDGNYYWTVNGVWLTTPDGDRVRANGEDGKDGKDGKDGTNTAPLIRINDQGFWEVSTDNGKTWNPMLDSDGNPMSAVGADGKDGKDGTNGKDGADGKDGENGKDGKSVNPLIKSVVVRTNEDGSKYVIITLAGAGGNGEDIDVRIPIY